MRHVVLACCLAPVLCSAAEPPSGIREACRQFVQRGLDDPRSADFGEYWNWTVVANPDGTYSVGAKYRAANRRGAVQQMYSTCVIRVRGKDFVAESVTRLL